MVPAKSAKSYSGARAILSSSYVRRGGSLMLDAPDTACLSDVTNSGVCVMVTWAK